MDVTRPFLVYRDRIGVPSEIGFLRRQYIGFTQLRPVWTGRSLLPDAARVGGELLQLGGDGLLGPAQRFLFRHFGVVRPGLVGVGAGCLTGRDAGGPFPVLHAQFARGGALALPLALGLGLRMVVTLHGGDVSKQKNWRGTVLARRWPVLLREATRFVCVSDSVAEIAGRRGVPPEKLIVLPIGVEVPDRPPVRRPVSHLFVGRFVEKKGIVVLADAIRRLRAGGDQTPVVCVGDGPLRGVLEAVAREVPGVVLTGWLGGEAVRARMAEAVCLVVPSVVAGDGDAEGLPSVIPEAMAQGCLVIGSDQGGIAEAIVQGKTGLLVPAGDAAALADAMHQVGRDPGLRDGLGAAGFIDVGARLNARVQSARLEALLLSV
jgi:colanic acid/amylovoran biosynthesis glycosyltransferase